MPGGSPAAAFTQENLKYLSVEQAMYDYVQLIKHIKSDTTRDLKDRPVIVFGGSYGGMLAAWLRGKFPNVFAGAHAASAPVMFYPETVSPYGYLGTVTNTFGFYGEQCPVLVKKGFDTLNAARADKKQYPAIKKAFNLCHDVAGPEDVDTLNNMINGAYGTMAMVNYPYPADFEGSMPGSPVKVACSYYLALDPKKATNEEIWAASNDAMNVYYNWKNHLGTKCLDLSSQEERERRLKHVAFVKDYDGWDYMACKT